MKKLVTKLLLLLIVSLMATIATAQSDDTMVSGRVVSSDGGAVPYATIYLKGTTQGCTSDAEGLYHLKAEPGEYTIVATAVGFDTYEAAVKLTDGQRTRHTISMQQADEELEEVVVVAGGVGRVKKSAFNAVALDTKEMYNSTKSLSEALNQLPGMKMREAGGVGSDMQLMLDGFSGKHVKVFIDGVPQEGAGTAMGLNNLPVNYADRIEVYKGVVPVGLGTDAIGGVVNIITDKRPRRWLLDAYYSYGSFNTHKSYINFQQTLQCGLTYAVNFFQNYSDNSYYINNYVETWTVQSSGKVYINAIDKTDVKRVKRFNDGFHNETAIGKIGIVGKRWADRLMLEFNYSHFYKEIQTGVYQKTVYGKKHRHGYSLIPSIEYRKNHFLTKGLDLRLTANYNHNITENVDTVARHYNWYGDYYTKSSSGEAAYQHSEIKSTNWNATGNANYRIGQIHFLTLNHVFSDFRRTSRSYIGTSSLLNSYDIPKETRKNVTGLSYRIMPSETWNATAFAKYYNQYNKGPVSTNENGVGSYELMTRTTDAWGYGAAGTYSPIKDLQAKLSYEKAYRLPTTDELFGDEDLEAGRADLKPEKSDNFNFNLSYGIRFLQAHNIYIEGSLIYRNTKDYIKRGLDSTGSTEYGIYENHGHVKTKGYNISLRYTFKHWFSIGGTYNDISARDYETTYAEGTSQANIHYKDRLPNTPYRFFNADANFTYRDLGWKGNTLTLGYDNFWQHQFPLYWESIGSSSSKSYVPEQFSHNLSLAYSIQNGRYNISFECRNLTDEKLYDNFSLQKAGRAFYGKLRIHFEKQ